MSSTFQRARSDEQRAVRRQTILETAAGMLTEMPVAELTLNELSRRVGLAKSNVLRYFESREAVLLELLGSGTREWLDHLALAVPAGVSRRAGYPRRAGELAAVIAETLAARPVLCDLMSAQASVLEHNVSVEVVTRHKLASLDDAEAFTRLVRDALPEVGEDDATRYVFAVWLMTAALWAYSRPSAALTQAHEQEERLASTHVELPALLAEHLTTFALGLRAQTA